MIRRLLAASVLALALSGCADSIRKATYELQESAGCHFLRDAEEQACRQRFTDAQQSR